MARKRTARAEPPWTQATDKDLLPGVVTRQEVIDAYTGQLVLFRVVDMDDGGFPFRVEVIDRWPRTEEGEKEGWDRLGQILGNPDHPKGPYQVFRATQRIRSGPEYEEGMRKLVREIEKAIEEANARRGS